MRRKYWIICVTRQMPHSKLIFAMGKSALRMRHLTGYTNNPMEMRILRTFSPWAKMRLECGIYGVPQHTPMEMRILRTFSPWAGLAGWAGWLPKHVLFMRHSTGYN